MHLIVHICIIQIMDALLDKQTRFTFHDETQQTPLHLAAQYGMYEQVEALARQVASGLNERDEQGRTPLHNAVINGHRLAVSNSSVLEVYARWSIHRYPFLSPLFLSNQLPHFSSIHNVQLQLANKALVQISLVCRVYRHFML